MAESEISSAVIKRLPRYYRYLGDLLDKGATRISSKELSERMHVTASQIRQDLNNFGGFGQQGYGYNVQYLYDEIGKILGIDKEHYLVVVGAGHIGQAIANYSDFSKRGFVVRGIFDIKEELIGKKVGGITVRHVDELRQFIMENDIDIAAITVPKESANVLADDLASWGVKGIWNFAPVDLRVPAGVNVENVHLSDSLMRLSYSLGRSEG